MGIEDLEGKERMLIVVALQSLHHERVNAFKTAFTACELAGKELPNEDMFGIDEVMQALRRIGAR
ncbi:hypothetical protein J2I03_004514 [Escherichia coli]|nr:hypothetical protein [Escherichia coli]EIX8597365.1 hypothetical protein [Escherichia coli]